jgi:DNA-binding transcriptional LysR family regulator
VPVLEPFTASDSEEVHAIFLGQGGPMPARVRVFLDFLAERCRLS